MVAAERAQLIEMLRDLSEAEWESPSLCTGWRVRDVAGHLMYDTYSPLTYAVLTVKCLGSVDKTNEAIVTASARLTTGELVDALEHRAGRLSRFAPSCCWPTSWCISRTSAARSAAAVISRRSGSSRC